MNRLGIAALLLAAGCSSQLEVLEGENGSAAVPTQVREAFATSCAFGGCHDAATRAGGLSLAGGDLDGIIDGSSSQSGLPLVALGDVQGSYLAIKLLADGTMAAGERQGARMPAAGAQDAPEIAIILGWIAGAELPTEDETGQDDSAADTEGEDDATADESTGDEGSTGGESGSPEVACGLSDVAPTVQSPIEAGEGAQILPASIGSIIERNCGCHLTDDPQTLVENVPGYGGAIRFRTWLDFQADYLGQHTYEVVLGRVEGGTMPPLFYCSERDEYGFEQADFDEFTAWLAAGAPDSAQWGDGP